LAAGLFGALGTAATGDMSPEDWLAAIALGYLEGKAGELGGEAEEPAVPGLIKAGAPRLYPYDLERMEGVDRAHVLAVHCRESAPELIDRLRFNPKPPAVSTFPDRTRAQEAVQQAIDAKQDEIRSWLRDNQAEERLVLGVNLPETTGYVLTRQRWRRGRGPVATGFVELVLRRNSAAPLGFLVVTAYPVVPKATP
jgi:hypothetical protein